MTTTPTTKLPVNGVLIYTDGACSGNPGPGGFAAVLRRFENGKEVKRLNRQGGKTDTTNNAMELRAVISAMKCLRHETLPIIVRTDSKYIVENWNQRVAVWIANGWRKTDGKPVLNRDLWEQLAELAEGLRVSFEWVKGHADDPMNAEVDSLAVTARNKRKAAVIA
ncbi:ribonuclease H family protein [Tritonibacter mobilis]|uniref:ribonuclease H family protein n=1 Tax=Tritonibacter mobilis TaxID=379347 RepID=UPI001CD9E8B0|nr:ribonuclease H [Tritonibacter mobilis]MCA2009135.1 ribonuclease HI [Tritonibacter mobilis]